jgi:hypothetical protein
MRTNGHHHHSHFSGSDAGMHSDRPSVDFSIWSHESLALFAEEAYLRILELEDTLKAVMDAYRNEVKRKL